MPAQIHEKLASFAADRDETCFAQVVEEFGGVVFNGALRRTGDRQAAEEVAQNVFAIAARKARRLSRHPQLTAWFHTTTRFEASKAMQSCRRYQNRIEKLANEMNSNADAFTIEEQQSWRDALPHLDESLDHLSPADREIVYGRFFEDLSFKEIAEKSGGTEAASKMRLKRALGKLNGWLAGRGVTLSATALTTVLSAEFSKAAPAAVVSVLPSNAIAASSSVTFKITLTNTLNTMSTIKSTSVTAAAVLALGAIPIALQHSARSSLRAERESLRTTVADLGSLPSQSIHERADGAWDSRDGSARPVARFLAELEKPIVADDLIEEVSSAMLRQDMSAMVRVILPLSKLSHEAGKDLLAEVRASKKSEQSKGTALQFLSSMVNRPDEGIPPGEALDKSLSDGVNALNLRNHLSDWAERDAVAAIEWFQARRESGQLAGKGIGVTSDELALFSGLVEGLARSSPDRAIAFLEGVDDNLRSVGIRSVVPKLAAGEEHREQALELVNGLESAKDRGEAARQAALMMWRRGEEAGALAFVQGSNLDDQNLVSVITSLAIQSGDDRSRAWADRVAWAEAQVPESAHDELIGDLVATGYLNLPPGPIATWIESLPPGASRDSGLFAQSTALASTNHSVAALDSAEAISDGVLRKQMVRRAFIILKHNNAEAAAELARERGLSLEEIIK